MKHGQIAMFAIAPPSADRGLEAKRSPTVFQSRHACHLSSSDSRLDRLARSRGVQKHTRAAENEKLRAQVAAQARQLATFCVLKKYLPPALTDAILNACGQVVPASSNRTVATVFVDIRGYVAFSENVSLNHLAGFLATFHAHVSSVAERHRATVERFCGDGAVVFFNDLIALSNPAVSALSFAVELRERLRAWLAAEAPDLAVGMGVATGLAQVGVLGHGGRFDYAVIGPVPNRASRLCAIARANQVLIDDATHLRINDTSLCCELPQVAFLKGMANPVNIWQLRQDEIDPPLPYHRM